MRTFLIISLFYGVLFSFDLEEFKKYKGVIRIAGGTAHIPIMKEIKKEIESINPDIKISIEGGGSGVGIKKVGEGLVDIGNSGRGATKEEIKRYNLVLFKWAVDGIGIVVNRDNNISNLTLSQIRDIFSGKIKNWKEIGGKDRRIVVYTRNRSSGTRKVFQKKILGKEDITKDALYVDSNGAMKRAVSVDKRAIGYISAGFIDKNIKAVAINGVLPTKENIKSKKYPYSRGLYSITKDRPKGLVKAFIDYLYTPHVQRDLIPKKGFIPVK
ncbi:MAG: phosphate ABC transporter substrate-binding protein [Epsilonproteobacteria bacterium]|nr:phosphate ABC transporter substrate-binding protein [Campylobacterota bacterium]